MLSRGKRCDQTLSALAIFTKRLRRYARNNVLQEEHVSDKRKRNLWGLEANAKKATSYKLETKGCRHTMFRMRVPRGRAHVSKKHVRKKVKYDFPTLQEYSIRCRQDAYFKRSKTQSSEKVRDIQGAGSRSSFWLESRVREMDKSVCPLWNWPEMASDVLILPDWPHAVDMGIGVDICANELADKYKGRSQEKKA